MAAVDTLKKNVSILCGFSEISANDSYVYFCNIVTPCGIYERKSL